VFFAEVSDFRVDRMEQTKAWQWRAHSACCYLCVVCLFRFQTPKGPFKKSQKT
jgi:hypothetical protein